MNEPNFPYLLGAFAVVWVVLFGYVLVLVNRQKKLKQEIETLKEAMQEKPKGKAK